MEFGIQLPQSGAIAPESTAAVARAARDAGLSSLWVSDHVVLPSHTDSRYPFDPSGQFLFPPDTPVGESLITLAYAAAAAPGLKLGVSVLILPQRNPVLTAKQLATLDVLSGGGVILGIGAGWLAEEFRALDVDTFAARGAVLDEYMALLRALWSGERTTFSGRFYQVQDVFLRPRPRQRPAPPIWVGGHGRPSLRRAVRLGDGWHACNLGVAAFAEHVAALRAEAARQERSLDGLTLSSRVRLAVQDTPYGDDQLVGPPALLAERIAAYARAGAAHLVLGVGHSAEPVPNILRQIDRFAAEVLPLLPASARPSAAERP